MRDNLNHENIHALTRDKKVFLEYANKIGQKFNGPSAYFYQKVIDEIRENRNYASLFDNNIFIEYVYATLASWGMQRMDKNTRMAEFHDFKNSIIENKDRFIRICHQKIRTTILEGIEEEILSIFNSLKVMHRNKAPKFVANSKVMHYLLPDLIPPMDKAHVYYFFYGRLNLKGKKYMPKIRDENKTFWEILLKFQEIANKLDLSERDLKNQWDTSIPKIIDNAIIGFT